MHTFNKLKPSKYEIGHWEQTSSSGATQWMVLFYVDTIAHAIGAVSLLNGGGQVTPSFHPLDINGQDIVP